MEQGSQLQRMQSLVMQLHRLSNRKRDGRRGFSMSRLPRQKPIQFLRHLPNQNALEIASRCRRETQTIDFLEHELESHHGRLSRIDRIKINTHKNHLQKNEEPGTICVIPGSG